MRFVIFGAGAIGSVVGARLHGEIALLGRLHGAPTPVNAALCELAERHAREGRRPGSLHAEEILAAAA